MEDSYANNFSVSRHCDGGAYLLSVAALTLTPCKGGQLVRMPRPVPQTAVHNEFGCQCAPWLGSNSGLLREQHAQKNEVSAAFDHSVTATQHFDIP